MQSIGKPMKASRNARADGTPDAREVCGAQQPNQGFPNGFIVVDDGD